MLPKPQRLTVAEIEALSRGISVFSTLVSLRMMDSKETKFAVSVSKKVAARAVDRNRIRRRTYAALRKAKLKLRKPIFGMLMPKKEFLTIDHTALEKEVETLFVKAKLI